MPTPNQILFSGITGNNALSLVWQVQAGAVGSIPQGWPAIQSGQYATVATDGTPVIGSDVFLGFSNGVSTDTVATDGTVDLFMPLPGQILILPAKTPANIATQSQYNALVGTNVLFDISTGVLTIDESTANSTYGLTIVQSDVSALPGMVKFIVRQSVTFLS